MADDRKKQVQDRIAKEVTPQVDSAISMADAAMKELTGSIADVDEALKDKPDARIVDTAERDLVIDSRGGGKAVNQFAVALTALRDATKDDEDFEADQVEIKEIKKKLALKLQALKESLEEADKRKQKIEKWRVGAAKDERLGRSSRTRRPHSTRARSRKASSARATPRRTSSATRSPPSRRTCSSALRGT